MMKTLSITIQYVRGGMARELLMGISQAFLVPWVEMATQQRQDGSQSSTTAYIVIVEFILYIIDDWGADDYFYVWVDGTKFPLGHLGSPRTDSKGFSKGSVTGISWWQSVLWHQEDLGFGVSLNEKHLVELTIERDHFKDDLVFLMFDLDDPQLMAGMDDISVAATYNCSRPHHQLNILLITLKSGLPLVDLLVLQHQLQSPTKGPL